MNRHPRPGQIKRPKLQYCDACLAANADYRLADQTLNRIEATASLIKTEDQLRQALTKPDVFWWPDA